jgi:hypothetical protein
MSRKALNLTPEEREERRKEQMRRYHQSDRGKQKLKEAQDRYEKSEKGIKTRMTYRQKISKNEKNES